MAIEAGHEPNPNLDQPDVKKRPLFAWANSRRKAEADKGFLDPLTIKDPGAIKLQRVVQYTLENEKLPPEGYFGEQALAPDGGLDTDWDKLVEPQASRLNRALGVTAAIGAGVWSNLSIQSKATAESSLNQAASLYNRFSNLALSKFSALTTQEFLGEKTKNLWEDTKEKWEAIDKKKTARRALGAVAVTGAGILAFYGAKYGINLSSSASRVHEQSGNIINQPKLSLPGHVEGSVQLRPSAESASNLHDKLKFTHAVGKAAVNSAHETVRYHINRTINILPGMGYTQAIKERFANHSPAEYYTAYKAALKELGPNNIIKGVDHIRLANGDLGLTSGKAHFTKPAVDFFSTYFKSHR